MRYLLDTTFVIDHLNGEPAAVDRLRSTFEMGDEPIIESIVVCETAMGTPSHPDPDLLRFLEPLEFVQSGPEAALIAGRWRAEARAAGRTLSLADSLIAAAAVTNDAVVLTRNVRDFLLTPARVEDY